MNFLIRVFSHVLIIISLIILLYTFYRSEIYYDGKKHDYYSIYYTISLFLVFFSTITFFINKKIKEYLIISFVSLVISIYSFEFYFFLKNNKKYNIIEVYDKLKKKDENASIFFPPKQFLNQKKDDFFLSGISNSKTLFCKETKKFAIYQSDRYGFNNPDVEWDKEEIEYFLVGDSFTQGACVDRPHDITSVLRNLSNKSSLNVGYGGNGPLLEYATLREYLNPNVKKILWVYYEGNDNIELSQEIKDSFLMNYLNNPKFSQNLKNRQKEIDIYLKKIKIEKKNKLIFNQFIKLYNVRESLALNKNNFKNFKTAPLNKTIFENILNSAKKIASKNNSQLFFVYLPEVNRFIFDKYDNKNYMTIKKIVKDLDIVFIDVVNEMNNETKPLDFYNRHFNIKGYKKVAEKIYNLTYN